MVRSGVDDASTLIPRPVSAPATGSILTLTLLYCADVARVGQRAYLEGDEHELSRTSPLFGDQPIGDRYVSRAPLAIRRVAGGVSLQAPDTARYVVDGRPLAGAAGAAWQIFDHDALARGVVIEIGDRAVVLLHLTAGAPLAGADHGLVGASDAIAAVRAAIERCADLDMPVLLRGETGTGKELVARALHRARNHPDSPFVAVNIAALPPTTAASELFGHVRGAFTGATADRDGMFLRAHGGTLFLDEIGEMPGDAQPMLLRVLETSEVTPLGANRSREVAVRVIAATDADLETQIAEHGFRAALFHRLAGYQLFVPSLRERRDDIARLLVHFLREELAATGDLARLLGQTAQERLWLPAPIVARVVRYAWPGNVRQLRNAVRQLAVASRGASEARLDAALERLLASTPPPAHVPIPPEARARRDPAEISDEEVVLALEANRWRAAGAATQLGVSRSTMYTLIDRSKRIRKARDVSELEMRRVFDACSGDLDAVAAELRVSRRALVLRIAELGWER